MSEVELEARILRSTGLLASFAAVFMYMSAQVPPQTLGYAQGAQGGLESSELRNQPFLSIFGPPRLLGSLKT